MASLYLCLQHGSLYSRQQHRRLYTYAYNTGSLYSRQQHRRLYTYAYNTGSLYSRQQHRRLYWAFQAGLLTPLTYARHHLSPLAAFTSVRTFFTMEGGDSEFANFTLPTLKAFLEARSHGVRVWQ